MTFLQAKEFFDDAIKYIDPDKDKVKWDLLNGLSELSASLNHFQNAARTFERKAEQELTILKRR